MEHISEMIRRSEKRAVEVITDVQNNASAGLFTD